MGERTTVEGSGAKQARAGSPNANELAYESVPYPSNQQSPSSPASVTSQTPNLFRRFPRSHSLRCAGDLVSHVTLLMICRGVLMIGSRAVPEIWDFGRARGASRSMQPSYPNALSASHLFCLTFPTNRHCASKVRGMADT